MLKIIHVERGLGKFIIGGHILWGAIEFPSIRKGMHAIESRGLVFGSRGDCLLLGLGLRSGWWPVVRTPPLSSLSERFLRFSGGCLLRFGRVVSF